MRALLTFAAVALGGASCFAQGSGLSVDGAGHLKAPNTAPTFYQNNPPPTPPPAPAPTPVTWAAIQQKPTTLQGFGLTLALSDLSVLTLDNIPGVLPLSKGGTGQTSLAGLEGMLGGTFDGGVQSVGTGSTVSLEAVPTVGLVNYTVKMFLDCPNGCIEFYLLVPGTAETTMAQYNASYGQSTTGTPLTTYYLWMRPMDYNATTNAKVWRAIPFAPTLW